MSLTLFSRVGWMTIAGILMGLTLAFLPLSVPQLAPSYEDGTAPAGKIRGGADTAGPTTAQAELSSATQLEQEVLPAVYVAIIFLALPASVFSLLAYRWQLRRMRKLD